MDGQTPHEVRKVSLPVPFSIQMRHENDAPDTEELARRFAEYCQRATEALGIEPDDEPEDDLGPSPIRPLLTALLARDQAPGLDFDPHGRIDPRDVERERRETFRELRAVILEHLGPEGANLLAKELMAP